MGHLKGGGNLSKEIYLIDSSIFSFLFLDISADCLLVFAYGRDMITPGPKVLPSKILFATGVLPCDVYGTFAFYEANHL